MNILNLLPYSPVPPHFGGALRIFHILRAMAARHTVTVIAFGDNAAAEAIHEAIGGLRKVVIVPPTAHLHGLRKRGGQAWAIASGRSGIGLIYHSSAMQKAINEALQRERFDIIQMESYVLGSYRLDGANGAIRIVDAQNVEYDSAERIAKSAPSRLRRWFYEREAKNVRREEIDVYRRHDALFVTSARDGSLLADVPRVPKFVIPNGVDLGYFRKSPSPVRPHSLVFSGSMNYYPNADGVIYFLQEIFPLILRAVPDATITVVGNNPPKSLLKFRAQNIEITGFVPDVRPFINGASVYVVPLRMGGGTRLKVLEAMAMKKPVVTTSIGSEGISLRHGESLMVADDPREFADSVVELLRKPEKAARLIEVGHETVRRDYSWEAVGERVQEAYRALTQEFAAHPVRETLKNTGTD